MSVYLSKISFLFVGVFGLAVGSFLAALTYRFPRRISIAAGRSFCDRCKKQISWFDNIPLLSFLLLRGRCRNCQKKISFRYPAIEAATALVFVASFYLWEKLPRFTEGSVVLKLRDELGFASLPFLFIVLAAFVVVFVIDLEHQIIPDSLIFFLVFVETLLLLVTNPPTLFVSLLCGFTASLFLLLLHLGTSGHGMGLGDVKFAIPAGFLLGWPATLGWLFGAFLTGGAVGAILLLTGRARLGKKIAFGPFLVVSLGLVLFLGERYLIILKN